MKKYLSFTAISLAVITVIGILSTGSFARAAEKPNILVV